MLGTTVEDLCKGHAWDVAIAKKAHLCLEVGYFRRLFSIVVIIFTPNKSCCRVVLLFQVPLWRG